MTMSNTSQRWVRRPRAECPRPPDPPHLLAPGGRRWGCGGVGGEVPPPRPRWLEARSLCVTARPEGLLARAARLGLFHGLREVTHVRTLIQHPARGQHAGRSQRTRGRRPGIPGFPQRDCVCGTLGPGAGGNGGEPAPTRPERRRDSTRRAAAQAAPEQPEAMTVSGSRGAGGNQTRVQLARTRPGKRRKSYKRRRRNHETW